MNTKANGHGTDLLLPKSNLIFKLIFGDRRNIDILKDFLAATLDIPIEEYDTVELVDPHPQRENLDDRLNVHIRTKAQKWIDVEIEVPAIPVGPENVTCHALKLLASQPASGQGDGTLRRIVSIIILDYPLIQDSDHYRNRYRFCSGKTGSLLTDVLEINTLELPKVPEDYRTEDGESRELFNWLRFLRAGRREEFEMAATQSPAIGKAYTVLKELSENEQTRMLYEAREKARRDAQGRLMASFDKGKVEGEAKGRLEIKIEAARNLIARGTDISDITQITGLSDNQVRQLMNP